MTARHDAAFGALLLLAIALWSLWFAAWQRECRAMGRDLRPTYDFYTCR